jgi:hypothetical protein
MSVLSASTISFLPILGILTSALVVIVLVVAIASAVRREDGSGAGPVAFFLFGMSLLTISLGVVSAGVLTYSVSELVGPSPQGIFSAIGSSTNFCSSSSGSSSSLIPTNSPSSFSNSNGTNIDLCGNSGSSDLNLAGSNSDTDPYISAAVFAGIFLVIAVLGFGLAFSRARRLVGSVGFGRPTVGRLPLTYAFLMAGLAAISLLAFVPIAGDSIFRAIAPGVNGTSGHAGGLRMLVTFAVLSGLSAAILVYHLRMARSLREPDALADDSTATL